MSLKCLAERILIGIGIGIGIGIERVWMTTRHKRLNIPRDYTVWEAPAKAITSGVDTDTDSDSDPE